MRKFLIKFLAFFGEPGAVEGDGAENFIEGVNLALGSIELVNDNDLLVFQDAKAGFKIPLFVAQGVIGFGNQVFQFTEELSGVLNHKRSEFPTKISDIWDYLEYYALLCGRRKFINCIWMSDKKLIVVAGPTAVGKTAVSLHLARVLETAIVSADSRQIFREMTIGTAKPSPDELGEVPHYFIDSASVVEDYDAARYATEALAVIEDLLRKKDQVILCGGSGLYIKGVCEGFDEIPPVSDEIRNHLVEQYKAEGLPRLQEQLREKDPEAFHSIDSQNPHRVIRALEVKLSSGQSILSFRKNERKERNFAIVKVGLELPREALYARIDKRMDDMIAAGLFDEARRLYPLRHKNALQTVGYQEIFAYMENAYDREECIRLLKRNSRRYAKRQLTWFKKDPEFRWFRPEEVREIVGYVGDLC